MERIAQELGFGDAAARAGGRPALSLATRLDPRPEQNPGLYALSAKQVGVCTEWVMLVQGRVPTMGLSGLAMLAVIAGCGDARGNRSAPMMGGGSGYYSSPLRCSAPSRLPGQTVAVSLADMGMRRMMAGTAPLGGHMKLTAVPAEVRAGPITLVASNFGWRTHELVILPLDGAAQEGQLGVGPHGTVPESTSVGEASKSCEGGPGEGIKAGAIGWATVTLVAGRYELICNLPNHYANGMHQLLVVD